MEKSIFDMSAVEFITHVKPRCNELSKYQKIRSMQQTKWHQPWAGVCPVSGEVVAEEPIDKYGIIHWRAKNFQSIGRVLKRAGELDVIFLDNPDVVYENYPEEKTFIINISTRGGEIREQEVRESHLLPYQIDLIAGDTLAYIQSLPADVQKKLRNHYRESFKF